MQTGFGILTEYLSAETLTRIMRSLDRTATVMIITVWTAAVLMMSIALYTVSAAHQAKQQAENAAAIEPMLPIIKRAPLARMEMDLVGNRMRTRYRSVNFNVTPDGALNITSSDASGFSDWLAALGYLDTVAPEARWSVRDLCVGSECGGASLMRAVITAERVTFRAPSATDSGEDREDKPKKKKKKS